MELQHVNVKIPVEGELAVAPREFIDVFHQWIRDGVFDELLIDVADYRHVPRGPGVILIGHEADYSMDNAGNRYGMLYSRKSPVEGSDGDRFLQAFQSAAVACQMLEAEFQDDETLLFSRQEFELFINDRALAPNTPETFAACRPQLESFLKTTLGHDEFSLEHNSDPRCRFGVVVNVARPFELTAILEAAL